MQWTPHSPFQAGPIVTQALSNASYQIWESMALAANSLAWEVSQPYQQNFHELLTQYHAPHGQTGQLPCLQNPLLALHGAL